MQKLVTIPFSNSPNYPRLSEYENRLDHLLANGYIIKAIATTKDERVFILETVKNGT